MSATTRDNSDSTQTIFLSGPAGLARILAQDQPEAALWGPEEMRAMWLHQLRAPLEADLAAIRSPGSSPPSSTSETLAFKDKSFYDLLLKTFAEFDPFMIEARTPKAGSDGVAFKKDYPFHINNSACQKPDRQGGLLINRALPDGRASDRGIHIKKNTTSNTLGCRQSQHSTDSRF